MAINKEDYLYISSLLRAREPRMLSRDKAERMLDAPNVEDAAKMLTDSGYEDMSQMGVKQIETALARRRADVFRELESLVPNAAVLDLFRLKYDYHNAKVLIKSDAMHHDDNGLLSASGRICGGLLLHLIFALRYNNIRGNAVCLRGRNRHSHGTCYKR